VGSVTHEVEVKYRVENGPGIERALAERGLRLSEPVLQDDQAYAPVGWEYGMSKRGVPFARLRSQGGQCLFTVKQPIDNEMACREHETLVEDRDQMHQALLLMGFRPTVRIVKTRRTANVGDLSICLDEVEHAGVFLEVEKVIGPGGSGSAVQTELDQFVRSFGVGIERLHDTYDSLVRNALTSRSAPVGASGLRQVAARALG
jgi:adenylate cyclase, class 2